MKYSIIFLVLLSFRALSLNQLTVGQHILLDTGNSVEPLINGSTYAERIIIDEINSRQIVFGRKFIFSALEQSFIPSDKEREVKIDLSIHYKLSKVGFFKDSDSQEPLCTDNGEICIGEIISYCHDQNSFREKTGTEVLAIFPKENKFAVKSGEWDRDNHRSYIVIPSDSVDYGKSVKCISI